MKTITAYEADNGKLFTTEEACQKHEQWCAKEKEREARYAARPWIGRYWFVTLVLAVLAGIVALCVNVWRAEQQAVAAQTNMPPGFKLVCAPHQQVFTFQPPGGAPWDWADDVTNDKAEAIRRAWKHHEWLMNFSAHRKQLSRVQVQWETCE